MPAVPPSYDQAMAAQPGPAQYQAPGAGQPMYPQLPTEKGGLAPPPAMPPAPGGGATVVTQVQYVQAPRFGYRPVKMVCPHCQASITTRTDEETSAMAWIVCLGLCFVGLWPCSCIPFCVDSMKQVSFLVASVKSVFVCQTYLIGFIQGRLQHFLSIAFIVYLCYKLNKTFLLNQSSQVTHSCPSCKNTLGRYKGGL